jgi:hypothetical protein
MKRQSLKERIAARRAFKKGQWDKLAQDGLGAQDGLMEVANMEIDDIAHRLSIDHTAAKVIWHLVSDYLNKN